ncbi:LysR family transcriptional regulator [Microvirga sp. G4-2]|uniref:LysR family transcriptional regulator n=1 Tax=Microvirga sp. G4-2 TaxID=3434467 RepID=UPI004044AA75
MNLEHLRTFTRAAELGSFTKAAVSLGVAQPTVSRIISELEAEWDGPLFYRTGRGVALSELGQEALMRAQSLLREVEQVSEDLRAFSRLPSGNVSLGLPPSLISYVIPKLLNQLRRERPGIRLRVYEGFSEQIERWLSEGIVDVGIYSKYKEGSLKGSGLMLNSRLVLAGVAAHWDLPDEIDFEQLANFPLVLPALTNGLRMAVDAVAKRMRIELTIVAEADSILAQKEMTLNCGCYMIKAPQTIAGEKHDGIFASSVIRNPYINRHVVLVTGQQKPLSRASREVAARATSILRGFSSDI